MFKSSRHSNICFYVCAWMWNAIQLAFIQNSFVENWMVITQMRCKKKCIDSYKMCAMRSKWNELRALLYCFRANINVYILFIIFWHMQVSRNLTNHLRMTFKFQTKQNNNHQINKYFSYIVNLINVMIRSTFNIAARCIIRFETKNKNSQTIGYRAKTPKQLDVA